LSYHATTFTSPATTLVDAASTMDEAGLPVKSMETSSCSSYARMPLSGPSAAARRASFTSAAVTVRPSSQVRSTTETSGVGTRTAMPSILPFTSGITRLVALAAPVVVGIIDRAAARARRRSLCGRSRMFWSLV
jgi:hypothetical protein